MPHISFTALSQVVGEVVVDVRVEAAAVLRVEPEDLPQSPNADVLQVTVGQCLHIRIGLDHLVMCGQVSPNKVTFACTDRGFKQRCYNAKREQESVCVCFLLVSH